MSENRRFFDVAANMACRDAWRSTAEICQTETEARALFWRWLKAGEGKTCFFFTSPSLSLSHSASSSARSTRRVWHFCTMRRRLILTRSFHHAEELGSDDGAELRELRDAPSERVDDRRRCPALRDA